MPPAKILVSAIGVSVPFAAGEDSCAPCTETCERDYRARSIDRSGTAEATEHAIVIRDQAQRPSAATKNPDIAQIIETFEGHCAPVVDGCQAPKLPQAIQPRIMRAYDCSD